MLRFLWLCAVKRTVSTFFAILLFAIPIVEVVLVVIESLHSTRAGHVEHACDPYKEVLVEFQRPDDEGESECRRTAV